MSKTTSHNIEWRLRQFNELTPHELYAVLQLRSEVFVVEQQCIFQDIDNKDPQCHHFMGWMADKLVACTRIVPPGVSFEYPSIGRVVTSPSARGIGLGRTLMQLSIHETENLYGKQSIRIGAQVYLKEFYESLGFFQTGDIYMEDGIEHIEMTRS